MKLCDHDSRRTSWIICFLHLPVSLFNPFCCSLSMTASASGHQVEQKLQETCKQRKKESEAVGELWSVWGSHRVCNKFSYLCPTCSLLLCTTTQTLCIKLENNINMILWSLVLEQVWYQNNPLLTSVEASSVTVGKPKLQLYLLRSLWCHVHSQLDQELHCKHTEAQLNQRRVNYDPPPLPQLLYNNNNYNNNNNIMMMMVMMIMLLLWLLNEYADINFNVSCCKSEPETIIWCPVRLVDPVNTDMHGAQLKEKEGREMWSLTLLPTKRGACRKKHPENKICVSEFFNF